MNDTQPTVLMNQPQARIFREAYTSYVQRMSRKTKVQLADEYRSELEARGITSLYGGPVTKDEMLNAIIYLRYPISKLNESSHVLYHTDGITNDACAYCYPDPCPKCGALDTCDYGSGFGAVVNGRHVNA